MVPRRKPPSPPSIPVDEIFVGKGQNGVVMAPRKKPLSPPEVHVDDVFAAIEPTFLVARLLGLAPLSLSNASPRGFSTFTIATLHGGVLCGVIVLITVLTLADLTIAYLTARQLAVQTAVSYSQIVFDAVFALYLIVSARTDAQAAAELFRRLAEVDSTLAGVGVGVDCASSRRAACAVLAASGLLFAVNYLGLVASMLFASYPITYTLAMYWVLYQTPKVFAYGFTVYLSNTLLLLRKRFGAIRNHLDQLSRRSPGAFIVIAKQRIMETTTPTLPTLRAQHDALCDLADDVNTRHSRRVLLFATSAFVNLTTELNYVIVQLLVYSMSGADVAHSTVLLLTVVLQVVFVAVSCAVTSREANSVAHFVHKLLAKTRDFEQRDELRVFSLQLMHRKVQFTASGFFVLDSTLLYSIVGGVTTYLVILIQFQLNAGNTASALTNVTTAQP